MRLKILALLSLISIAIASYGLYSNLTHVDFFATKNSYLHNEKRIELLKQQNVDSLRATALKILDSNEIYRTRGSEHIMTINTIFIWLTLLSIGSLIGLSFEFFRKTKA